MTTWPARVPIRVRITAAFAAVMTILLVGMGILAYRWMSSALLDEVDSGLRFRAAAAAPSGATGTVPVGPPTPRPAARFRHTGRLAFSRD